MASVALPIQEAVRDLTADLFGRGTVVDKATGAIAPDSVGAVVSYRDDEGDVVAVAVMDKDAVAIMGAALAMVPQVAVQEARRTGRLPENLYENFWEVANILGSLLNRPGHPHLKLVDRSRSLDDLEPDVRTTVDAPGKQRQFAVTVLGYGTGRLSLYAA